MVAPVEPVVPMATGEGTAAAVGPFEFDRATALRPVAPGRFAADIDPGWTVGPKPHGGYLLALAARAAADTVAGAEGSHLDPLVATAHYLAAPDVGPAEVGTEILTAGRTFTRVRSVLHQDGRPCVEATFTMGDLPPRETEPWWSDIEAPPGPPRDTTSRHEVSSDAPFKVAFLERIDLRIDPDDLGYRSDEPSGRGELRGWVEFADGRPTDGPALLFFADALPPSTVDLGSSGWVPTLSLTVYLRGVPAPGPLRLAQRVQLVAGGRIDEVCEIWDQAGRLVAQATQLALIRLEPDQVAPLFRSRRP